MARTLTGILVGIGLLAATCGGPKGTVSITLQISGDPEEARAYREVVAMFERSDDAKVKLVVVPKAGDHVTKLVTAFSAGNPPDLFLLNYRRFGQFAARGVLEPMGVSLAGSNLLREGTLYPQSLDAFRWDGAVLCLPQNISSQVVYLNVGVFRRLGVALPPERGWDWSAFLRTARALTRDTNGDGKTDVYGLGLEPEFVRLAPFVWQAGGEVVDDVARPTKTTMLGPKELAALKFFIELRRVHRVVPSLAEFESEDMEARFQRGGLAMIIDSRRITPTLRAVPGLEWDVAPLPSNARPATMLHSDAFCMARASRDKPAALRFVEFALGPEGAAILARSGRTVPSNVAVSRSEAFLTPGTNPAHARVFLDQIAHIRRFPNIGSWNEIETKADPVIEEWFFGEERIEALGIEIDLATRELFASSSGGG